MLLRVNPEVSVTEMTKKLETQIIFVYADMNILK